MTQLSQFEYQSYRGEYNFLATQQNSKATAQSEKTTMFTPDIATGEVTWTYYQGPGSG